jgi:hypothetical protein
MNEEKEPKKIAVIGHCGSGRNSVTEMIKQKLREGEIAFPNDLAMRVEPVLVDLNDKGVDPQILEKYREVLAVREAPDLLKPSEHMDLSKELKKIHDDGFMSIREMLKRGEYPHSEPVSILDRVTSEVMTAKFCYGIDLAGGNDVTVLKNIDGSTEIIESDGQGGVKAVRVTPVKEGEE